MTPKRWEESVDAPSRAPLDGVPSERLVEGGIAARSTRGEVGKVVSTSTSSLCKKTLAFYSPTP